MPKARKAALATVHAWAEAFAGNDVDAVVDLFAPDVLFIGTSSGTVVSDVDGVRDYFAAATRDIRPREVKLNGLAATVLTDESVVVTALDEIVGVETTLRGRLMFVLAKRNGDWRIAGFHRSAMPG